MGYMALVKCKECGQEVSQKAGSCPKCGAPIKKKTSMVTWVIVILFILWLIGYIGTKGSSNNQSKGNASLLAQLTHPNDDSSRVNPAPEGSIDTPQNKTTSKENGAIITTDQLMTNCIVQYRAALGMGREANEYINQIKYMNKEIAVKGQVYYVERVNNGAVSFVSFTAGPCLAEGGNFVRFYPRDDNKDIFNNIQLGQSVIITGRFDNYGRLREAIEEERRDDGWLIKSCGYYAILKECKITN